MQETPAQGLGGFVGGNWQKAVKRPKRLHSEKLHPLRRRDSFSLVQLEALPQSFGPDVMDLFAQRPQMSSVLDMDTKQVSTITS